MKFSGVLVLLFSLYTLNSGFNLLGVPLKNFVSGSSSGTITADATLSGKKQIVNMAVQKTEYVPNSITIQKSVPVEWHIDGSGAIGCTSIITIPSLGITKNLKLSGDNVIAFTPQKTGNLHFTCGMGMASGDFVVVDTLPAQQKGVTACDPTIQECRI